MIFRNDDIYLTESPRGFGVYYDFKKFKKAHELLKGQKHLLAIIAGEIENHPELTEYILANRTDFLFGIHGWAHERYSEWPEESVYQSLKRAKEKVAAMFDEKIEWFCPPWNKSSEAIYRACERLGLKVQDQFVTARHDLPQGRTAEMCCYHYWNDEEMANIWQWITRQTREIANPNREL